MAYEISSLGSQPLPERVTDLQGCPPPKSVSHLRGVLGMLNFNRRFLPHTVSIQAPIHDALSDPRVKDSHSITWTAALITDLDECKAKLSRAALLAPGFGGFTRSRILQLLPSVLSSNKEHKARSSSPSFPISSARHNKNIASTTGSS